MTTTDLQVTIDDVHRAAEATRSRVVRTPLLRSAWLSDLLSADVWLKCESLQRTGSFKLRGAIAALSSARPRSVVAASAGNHGQALALAARDLDVPCTVVVPRGVPQVKADAIRAHGAKLVMPPPDYPGADGYDGAEAYMLEHAAALGERIVSPFEDVDVVAGNGGTLALEVLDQRPDIDVFVVPCGGGGCVGGVGVVARNTSRSVHVFGVNTDASPGMWRSFRDGWAHLEVGDGTPTIADGIEGGVRRSSYALCRRVVDEIVLTREATLRDAAVQLALREKLVVEGAGAAGVGALLDRTVEAGGRTICVVLTGGNIDRSRLCGLLDRGAAAPT